MTTSISRHNNSSKVNSSKMPKKRTSESGFVEDEITISSARKSFFSSYMPQLEAVVRENAENNNWDDPTIDLDLDLDLVPVRSSSPILNRRVSGGNRSRKPIQSTSHVARASESETCHQVSVKADTSFSELKCILQEISTHTPWGEKLLDILINGLRSDYPQDKGFNVMLVLEKGEIPINWIPIIKMNNLNTPYIEFLFKVDRSDEPPDAQLTNFTSDHLLLGYEVMKHITERLKKSTRVQSMSQPPTPRCAKTTSVSNQVVRRHTAPPQPLPQQSSFKQQQQQRQQPMPQKRLSSRDLNNESMMNDSIRILPTRSCKQNRTYRAK